MLLFPDNKRPLLNILTAPHEKLTRASKTPKKENPTKSPKVPPSSATWELWYTQILAIRSPVRRGGRWVSPPRTWHCLTPWTWWGGPTLSCWRQPTRRTQKSHILFLLVASRWESYTSCIYVYYAIYNIHLFRCVSIYHGESVGERCKKKRKKN